MAPEAVLTVRTYGTGPLYDPGLVRKSAQPNTQTSTSTRQASREPRIVAHRSRRSVLAMFDRMYAADIPIERDEDVTTWWDVVVSGAGTAGPGPGSSGEGIRGVAWPR